MERGNIVLTRRVGEIAYIGDAVVKISEIRGQRVKLHINAPKDVGVHRFSAEERAEYAEKKYPAPAEAACDVKARGDA